METKAPGETAAPGFWQRRVLGPLRRQLQQGFTPEKLALTLALGFTVAIFPILGSTTLLCALVAWAFRLNQPVMHAVNYAGYPLQVALLIPFYRAGETLFAQPHVPLSIPLFFERIQQDFWKFLRDFGAIALEGIAVWCLLAPALAAALYFGLRAPLRRLADQRG